MSQDTTTSAQSTDETAQNAQPAWLDSPFAQVFENAKPALEDVAEQHNSLVAQIKAQGSERDQINELLNSSDDPNIVEYRRLKEELENELANNLETIENHIRNSGMLATGDFDVAAAEKNAKELADKWKKLTAGLKAFDGGEAFVSDLTKLNGLRSGGNSTGQQRSRWANLEIKKASDSDDAYERVVEMQAVKDESGSVTGQREVQTFTVLAKELSKRTNNTVTSKDLYEHSKAENKDDGRPFVFAVGNYLVRATPKSE